jgi:transposase
VDLYQQILGLSAPWSVSDVNLDVEAERVEVQVVHEDGVRWKCPECERTLACYDHAPERSWRHLDTCQFETVLTARIPRVRCPEHGVRQVAVPWAGKHARFTLLMERLAIDVLLACQTVQAASRILGLSWDEVQHVMQRAVERGLARKAPAVVARVGVDEKAFRKGHSYVTVVCDIDRGCVEYVAQDRKKSSLAGYFQTLNSEQLQGIAAIAMDMWEPYIQATKEAVPLADQKIVFDRFHVMKMMTTAVDKVRRQEHRELKLSGDQTLTKTKYLWLA